MRTGGMVAQVIEGTAPLLSDVSTARRTDREAEPYLHLLLTDAQFGSSELQQLWSDALSPVRQNFCLFLLCFYVKTIFSICFLEVSTKSVL